ncbi:hypothetical protein L7F22_032837 [Adiantum nelumboides]|nr:hypothetical protein [Adiantum nelumboides]
MVVHRMHVRLEELDMSSDKLKRMYVLADVVELPSQRKTIVIPATVSAIIMCRVLYIPYIWTAPDNCTVVFPDMRFRVVETSLEHRTVQVFALPPSDAVDNGVGSFGGLYIHADRFIYRQATSFTSEWIQPLQLRVRGSSTFSSTFRPDWPETLPVTNINQTITLALGSFLTPSDSDLQRSDEIEFLQTEPQRLQVGISRPGGTTGLVLLVENSPEISFFPAPSLGYIVPADVLADPSIILGMQMNMLSAELVLVLLTIRSKSSKLSLSMWNGSARSCFRIIRPSSMWVASPSDDILALLFRVQAFIKMAKQSRSVVPRLQYHVYSNLINRMVQVAQDYDQEFRKLRLFIAQNEILGNYLLQQNKAFADKEKDMSAFHSQVVSMRRSERSSTIEMMGRLSLQMETESEAMNEAKDSMVEAIQEYERKQLARALFAVLGAIASVALARCNCTRGSGSSWSGSHCSR